MNLHELLISLIETLFCNDVNVDLLKGSSDLLNYKDILCSHSCKQYIENPIRLVSNFPFS